MSLAVRCAAESSVGLVRKDNEDSAYAGHRLLAVADGLGGHVGGEVASAIVIGSLQAWDAEVPTADLLTTLGRAVSAANDWLHRAVEDDPKLDGMGTTLTAMLWSGAQMALAHIGDSRAYRLREGSLHQITEDHTLGRLVADVAASGLLAPVLVRYLDGRPDRSPDLGLREFKPGDRYLLCTDGLSGVLDGGEISEVLATETGPGAAARRLIGLANGSGGPDNVTVVIADVTDATGKSAPVRPMTVGAAAEARLSPGSGS